MGVRVTIRVDVSTHYSNAELMRLELRKTPLLPDVVKWITEAENIADNEVDPAAVAAVSIKVDAIDVDVYEGSEFR